MYDCRGGGESNLDDSRLGLATTSAAIEGAKGNLWPTSQTFEPLNKGDMESCRYYWRGAPIDKRAVYQYLWRELVAKRQTVSGSYALKIAIPYFVISVIWILYSDKFVSEVSSDVAVLTTLQTYKGWFFVTVSAIFVYFTSRRYLNRIATSERKVNAKEIALAENQEGIIGLLAHLPGMAFRCSSEGDRKMEFVSDTCRSVCDYSPNQLVGESGISWNSLIADEDREIVMHEIKRAVRDHTTYHLEYRIRTANGQMKWVSEQGCAIHSAIDNQKILVGYVFDIGGLDQPVSESEACFNGHRFRTAMEHSERSVTQGTNLIGRPL